MKPAPLDILESRGFETGVCLYSSLAVGEGGRKKDLDIWLPQSQGTQKCPGLWVAQRYSTEQAQQVHSAINLEAHGSSARGVWTKRHKGSAVEESCDISFIWSFVPFRLNSAGWDHIRLT